MNISPSLIIWTIICFGLFALVLDRLLFRPVLKVMDERKAKLEGARQHLEQARNARAEALEAKAREAERQRLAALEQKDAELSDLRRRSEEELRALSRELEAKKLENDGQTRLLEEQAGRLIDDSIEELAEAYAQKLIRGEKL